MKASSKLLLVEVLSDLSVVGANGDCFVFFENNVILQITSDKKDFWVILMFEGFLKNFALEIFR